MSVVVDKVAAIVTRNKTTEPEVLLFRHPTAGIQTPAGTVELGESIEAAALREAREETGLGDFEEIHLRASFAEVMPENTAVMAASTPVYSRPDETSSRWAHLRRGLLVEPVTSSGTFQQVCYTEYDDKQSPSHVTYQIKGWVPETCVGQAVTRHVFQFVHDGPTEDEWTVSADNHVFTLFWSPLQDLPQLDPLQLSWIAAFLSTVDA